MPLPVIEDSFPLLRDLLQIIASVAVILVAFSAAWMLRGAGRQGNRVQLDIDLQVIDLGVGTDLVGELMIVLQNMGPRYQKLPNLFVEVRPSRRGNAVGLPIVPVTNMIARDDFKPLLAPGVRQVFTWTFDVPRDDRLVRATALINTGKWLDAETVPALAQEHFWAFGATARYVTRVFEVSPSTFRRF
jgi:hypothetical protein